MKVLVTGASGTIGRAVLARLLAEGHDVTCLARSGRHLPDAVARLEADLTQPKALAPGALAGIEAVISCMASRSGTPADAWAVDHAAQSALLRAAKGAGVGQFVLLSAICVQKPLLEFQRAKLAFEAELQASNLRHAIVRPTAFFKSLSGQVARVRAGKPFLLFGDGRLTACKPISDRDLAGFIVGCLTDPARDGILPIGGPGPAITPREQGEMLFQMTGQTPRFRSLPVGVMDAIIGALSLGGWVVPALRAKAEFARIGRYYATESMLVWDGTRYNADATPEFGTDTLSDHYAALVRGEAVTDLGEHAVF
ncbi:MAG: divinylchlorophyllide 8-vinylreductase [Roseibaca calidilacus]|uniref:Divinyl chlorophyllide a 8-vinyl-reductase, chloroplastic n=1 Tax=Roseibaca calidilacus TaxID=1666912 RepID=A0A0P7X0A5_9RHOB|nr:NAD(P)H-binding protein [Roseibaca calidilacus]KPP93295.1 MAG: divinylchlorophyllide 8-vinylreductase [Roseibaca calidilacus]CUX83023.1 divinylchlorophyllide 8-vinylreductase [Roseibaca calidilacus]